MSQPNLGTASGFCSVCQLYREDYEGVNVTDCICTAKQRHDESCLYVKAVSCPIEIGIYCKHGTDRCEECDCDCEKGKKTK